MDSTKFNYNSDANVEQYNTCVSFVYGCMDTSAFNYDSLANAQDGDVCAPKVKQ